MVLGNTLRIGSIGISSIPSPTALRTLGLRGNRGGYIKPSTKPTETRMNPTP